MLRVPRYACLAFILMLLLLTVCSKKSTDANAKCSTPTFYPSGGSYTQSTYVYINCTTAEAVIRYTSDGSDPTESSQVYNGELYISSSVTIKARAYKEGMEHSDVGSVSYYFSTGNSVATPVISPAGGTYSSSQSVQMSCATSGATIRYTTDESIPTSTSTIYSGAIMVSSTKTIKAKGFKTGLNSSATATATFTIGTSSNRVQTPSIYPMAVYPYILDRYTIHISCLTSGAQIRYYVGDNTSFNLTNATLYTGPFTLYLEEFNTTWISAQAFKSGMQNSNYDFEWYKYWPDKAYRVKLPEKTYPSLEVDGIVNL